MLAPPCVALPGTPGTPGANMPTVALSVSSDTWQAAPPSIGQIEVALTGNGRTQHRIWRIDMGPESAVVHVHPNDVASCVGVISSGNIQVPRTATARALAAPRQPAPSAPRMSRWPALRPITRPTCARATTASIFGGQISC